MAYTPNREYGRDHVGKAGTEARRREAIDRYRKECWRTGDGNNDAYDPNKDSAKAARKAITEVVKQRHAYDFGDPKSDDFIEAEVKQWIQDAHCDTMPRQVRGKG